MASNRDQIQQLREDGLRVFVSHRRPDWFGNLYTRHELIATGLTPEVDWAPTGGVTTVTITDQDGTTIAVGEAYCSERDNFNKRLGLTIALGRAKVGLGERKAKPVSKRILEAVTR